MLTAFKEVEDYLVASRQLADQVGKERQAADDYTRYREIALTRYKTGLDTYLNVLTAETSLLSTQLTLEQLRTQQMTATVELIAALGGGWDKTQLPSDDDIQNKKKKK